MKRAVHRSIVDTGYQQVRTECFVDETAQISISQPSPIVKELRRSVRLAAKDETRGGRRIYSTKPFIHD